MNDLQLKDTTALNALSFRSKLAIRREVIHTVIRLNKQEWANTTHEYVSWPIQYTIGQCEPRTVLHYEVSMVQRFTVTIGGTPRQLLIAQEDGELYQHVKSTAPTKRGRHVKCWLRVDSPDSDDWRRIWSIPGDDGALRKLEYRTHQLVGGLRKLGR